MNNIKQINVAILTDESGKPIKALEIKSFSDSKTYLDFKKVCEDNHKNIIEEKQKLYDIINSLQTRLDKAEAELKFNRGEITEKEFNEICHGIK